MSKSKEIKTAWEQFESEGNSQAGVELGWRMCGGEKRGQDIIDSVSAHCETRWIEDALLKLEYAPNTLERDQRQLLEIPLAEGWPVLLKLMI